MKIGYPCINTAIGCTSNNTFRLANYSKENLIIKIKQNLACLKKILEFNVQENLLFFRIGSGLIPFASHPICRYNWQKYFKQEFIEIGEYIKKNNIRISMHPDQFVVINAKNKNIVKKSIKEIRYHCSVLDLMGLNQEAKVQIHIGGVYGEKEKSIERFIKNYLKLDFSIKKRLAIENDHISYSLKDCLFVSSKTGIPILFDVYHHKCLNNNETVNQALKQASKTWKNNDGKLMVDYSSQKINARKGVHAETINIELFKSFLKQKGKIDFDIILELKDKQKSALKAVKLI